MLGYFLERLRATPDGDGTRPAFPGEARAHEDTHGALARSAGLSTK